jgi:hypothetical protein
MNKMLHIEDCRFNLPDDFNGTLGDALLILANYRLTKEKEQSISRYKNAEEALSSFQNDEDNHNCVITYCIDTKENILK